MKKTIAIFSSAIFLFQLFSFTAFAATLTETNCTGEFDAGTDSNTGCSSDTLILSDGQTSGTFTSQVLDAGSSATWSNLAWSPTAPYGKELPSNGGSDSGYTEGNIDMSNNVLYLKMNEASGNAVDSSGNGHTSDTSGVTYQASGKLNTALEFGNSDQIEIPDSNDFSIDTTGDLSIVFWLKTGDDVTTLQTVLTKGGATASGPWEWLLDIKDGALRVRTISSVGNNVRIEDIDIATNTWYHIAIVFTGTTQSDDIKIYKNGVESSSVVSTQNYTATNTNGPLYFGVAYLGGSARSLNATLDEIAIFSNQLTATEILDIYKRGALNASFDIASCDDAACSGETLSGDYNELDNSTNGLPSLSINPSENRYFQYKATLTGDGTYEPAIEDITLTYSTSGGGGGEGVPEFSTYVYILTFIVCGSIFFYYKPQLRKL